MSNGKKLLIMLIGIGCIIAGIICFGIRAWIQSDEGLDVEPDETSIGKSQQFILNTLLIFTIGLIILGVIILVYSFKI